jgi:hypothetical protein
MNSFSSVNRGIVVGCVVVICFGMAACGGGSSPAGGPGGPNLSLSTSMALASQDGTPAHVMATVTGNSGTVTLSVGGIPNGTSLQIVQPNASRAGTITLTSSAGTPAGTYPLIVTATAGNGAANQNLTLVVAVAVVASSTVDTNLGVSGKLKEFMSTSFQPAEWDFQFFQNHTASEPAQLNMLGPQHIRIQGISRAVPMKSNTGTASDWDFSKLDAIVQPVLGTADHSPEFQIAVAPNIPGLVDSSGHLIVNSANLTAFASYCANLVKYYNKGGFDWGGTHFKSMSSNPITWWGIFNEYNINGLTASEYVQLYDAVVPTMLTVDPTIKFSALEFADFGFGTGGMGDPQQHLPTFVAATNAGGVNAKVDIVSTHFYSSCNQSNPDI